MRKVCSYKVTVGSYSTTYNDNDVDTVGWNTIITLCHAVPSVPATVWGFQAAVERSSQITTDSSKYALTSWRLSPGTDPTSKKYFMVNRSPYFYQDTPDVSLLPWERWTVRPKDVLAVHVQGSGSILSRQGSCSDGQLVYSSQHSVALDIGETESFKLYNSSPNLIFQAELQVGLGRWTPLHLSVYSYTCEKKPTTVVIWAFGECKIWSY